MALFLRREIAPDIRLYYGPTIQTYSVNSDDNVGRIISYPELIGIDSLSMFKTRNYGGLATGLEIDNRNNPHYPTRGVKWKTFLQFNKGLGQNSSNFTQMSSDLSVYISSNIPPRMVVALRFGGAVNFGSYEFFQAQYLSGTDNLRGYRKNRFAGDRMFYNNLDIRLRLRDYKGYLFTGSYGVLLFHDVGRVWAKGESSARWHNGYGAGLWVSPARMFVVTTSYMWSKEGGLPLVSFGFQF
jgi:outer membrane protein assembly factor BamA